LALLHDDVSFDRLNIDPNHTNVYIVDNQATAVKMLNFGRVDLNCNNQISFREAVQALGVNQDEFTPAYIVSQISLGLATHKDTNSELYNQMQQAFDTIKQNGELSIL
jgi:polar amino acid transport system substrate-binding protein